MLSRLFHCFQVASVNPVTTHSLQC